MLVLALRWLLVAAIAAALFSWRRSGAWRRFPAFACYLALAGTAAASRVRMERWPGASWVRWQYVLVALRVLCAVEIGVRVTEGAKGKTAARIGLLLFPVGVLVIGWGIPAGGAVEAVAAITRHIEAGMVAGLLLLGVIAWVLRTNVPRQTRIHAVLYGCLMGNQLWQLIVWERRGVWSMEDWQRVNAFYTAVAIMLAAVWALTFSGHARADAAGPRGPRSLAASR